MIFHVLSSKVEFTEIIGFESDFSTVIVNNSYNANICS